MIALTGATGFLATHLIHAFRAKGIEYTCLVRQDSPNTDRLKKIQAPLQLVNFAEEGSIESALTSSMILIHALGIVNGTEELLTKVNIDYTRNVIGAAKRAGIRKIILISSVAAGMRHGFYGETKFQGEEILRGSGIPYTILRPAYIFGAEDQNNTALMIKTLKRFPVIPLLGGGDFKLQPVYVGDVVDLIIQAIYKPAENKIFNVAGREQISLRAMLEELSLGLGVRRLFLPIPLKPVQACVRIFLKFFPKTKLPAKQILELDKHEAFDISETSRNFHFAPLPFHEGCKRMFEDAVCAAS